MAVLPRIERAPWLERAETQRVFAALAAEGHAARAVGGAVRNALLGRPVTDIDIATAAPPEAVMEAVSKAGLKAVPTGLAHGTVTVVSGGLPYEVTTLREDVETHGRHATVAFTGDWEADARRRDFTINALFCSASGEVFDPLGGYDDLLARRVRFIGNAVERIREDYLRILRFFRLTATFGEGAPDADALAACVREREGLSILSAERVHQELMRLLVAPRAPEIVSVMLDYGLLPLILGVAPRPALLAGLVALEAATGASPDAGLRLAALAVEVPEDAERLRERLRLSNDEAAELLQAAERASALGPETPEAWAKAQLYALGEPAYRRRVLWQWARAGDPPHSPAWRQRFDLPAAWQPPKFPITGADVMALGVATGPRIGEILRTLEAWWIAGDFAAPEAALRTKLGELVSAGP